MPKPIRTEGRSRRPAKPLAKVSLGVGTAILVVLVAMAAVHVATGGRAPEPQPGTPLPESEATRQIGGQGGFVIDTISASPARSFEAFDAVTMLAIDLDGDGMKEILAHNDNNRFYIFNASGVLLAELETPHPSPWDARELAGPAVGDLTGDGRMEIVLTNSAGWVVAYEVQPHQEGKPFEVGVLWERHMDPHDQDPHYAKNMYYGTWDGHPGLDGPAFLADTTGDGRDEVFLQLDDMPGMFKLESDGRVAWWGNYSDGNAGPFVADLTGDGRLEVVFASDGGRLRILDARTMAQRCIFDARDHGAWPASLSISPTAADLTGDGRMEIAFGVRNVSADARWGKTPADDWIDRSHALYFAVTAECEVLWQRSWEWGNPHVHMMPVPVDVTGDGVMDLLFQDWNTVGHKPGAWQSTGPANLFAVTGATGQLLWRVETDTYWSNKNIAVADVTGDGEPEILANADHHGRDGIALFSLDGNRRGFVPAPEGWLVSRGPLVTDLGGGRLDIVLPVHRDSDACTRSLDVGCREGALVVFHTASDGEVWYGNNHALHSR